MTKKRDRVTLLRWSILCTVVFATPGRGADQTPEGANRFIGSIIVQATIDDNRIPDFPRVQESGSPRLANGALWTGPTSSEVAKYSEMYRRLDVKGAASGENICQLKISLGAAEVRYDGPSVAYDINGYRTSDFKKISRQIRPAWNFDTNIKWNLVSSAQVSGSTVKIFTSQGPFFLAAQKTGGEKYFSVHLVDEGIAARFAYAVEFLRLHCDPLSETGF